MPDANAFDAYYKTLTDQEALPVLEGSDCK